jgi:hypothetical protein
MLLGLSAGDWHQDIVDDQLVGKVHHLVISAVIRISPRKNADHSKGDLEHDSQPWHNGYKPHSRKPFE